MEAHLHAPIHAAERKAVMDDVGLTLESIMLAIAVGIALGAVLTVAMMKL
jgi:hypothetical protein